MTTESPIQISGSAPLYRRPEPLTPQDHAGLGLKHFDNPYFIANEQHFVPLLINEFGSAACNFPIVFAGEERTPLAVMGLKPGQNLFAAELPVRGETYVPAYIRRYPFTVATAQNGAETRAIVCIDRDSPLVGENPDQPFFDNGAYTDYTRHCVDFCQNYENERMLTLSIIGRMRDLDIFEHRSVEYKPTSMDGQDLPPVQVAGFFAVSQAKLHALPMETYVELRDQGILTAIFAHWMSQWHWDRLVARAGRLEAEERNAEAAKVPIKGKGKKPN